MNITMNDSLPAAPVLRFPARRGRPKISRPAIDTGTPELIMKRLLGETAEALDICLERGAITREQHWCGIHLRWLYTLRHGAPGVRAIDPSHLGGIAPKADDQEWRGAREKEYLEAMEKLSQHSCTLAMMNLCIFNERPKFLESYKPMAQKTYQEPHHSIIAIRKGLDLLASLWKR